MVVGFSHKGGTKRRVMYFCGTYCLLLQWECLNFSWGENVWIWLTQVGWNLLPFKS